MLKMPITSNTRECLRPDQLKRKSKQTQDMFPSTRRAPSSSSADQTLGSRVYAKGTTIQSVEIAPSEFAEGFP